MTSEAAYAEASVGPRRIVHGLLRAGLVLSIGLMTVGLVIKLASGDHANSAVKLFDLAGAPSTGDALMGVGIAVLGLTPALRVVVLAAIWAHQRDWRFVAVAGAVVATLVVAALLGGG